MVQHCYAPRSRLGTQKQPAACNRSVRVSVGHSVASGGRCKLVTGHRTRPTHVRTVESEVAPSVATEPAKEVKLAWFEKPCPNFHAIDNLKELEHARQNTGGKYIAVDFFAGWCASCKSSYPALCKIPQDSKLQQHITFYKANVDNEELAAWIKQQGVRGIPYMAVFSPSGEFIIGFAASFKKMQLVKQSLNAIISNPDALKFRLNPEGIAAPW